jgi:hypothetical protein
VAEQIFSVVFTPPPLPVRADGSTAKVARGQDSTELYYQDGGQSLTVEPPTPEEENGMFVRLMSWHEQAGRGQPNAHPQLSKMLGKRCRVTVEVLSDGD